MADKADWDELTTAIICCILSLYQKGNYVILYVMYDVHIRMQTSCMQMYILFVKNIFKNNDMVNKSYCATILVLHQWHLNLFLTNILANPWSLFYHPEADLILTQII